MILSSYKRVRVRVSHPFGRDRSIDKLQPFDALETSYKRILFPFFRHDSTRNTSKCKSVRLGREPAAFGGFDDSTSNYRIFSNYLVRISESLL